MKNVEKKDEHFPFTGIMIIIGVAGAVIFLIDVISEAIEGVVQEFEHVNQVIHAVGSENVTLRAELEKLRKKLKPEGETTS